MYFMKNVFSPTSLFSESAAYCYAVAISRVSYEIADAA